VRRPCRRDFPPRIAAASGVSRAPAVRLHPCCRQRHRSSHAPVICGLRAALQRKIGRSSGPVLLHRLARDSAAVGAFRSPVSPFAPLGLWPTTAFSALETLIYAALAMKPVVVEAAVVVGGEEQAPSELFALWAAQAKNGARVHLQHLPLRLRAAVDRP